MICSFCKAEIEDGSLYCNKCGKAMQIVPDYNVLEDDVLPAIIHGDTEKKPVYRDSEDGDRIEGRTGLFSTKSARRVAILFILIFLVFVAGFIGIYTYTHSYAFLMQKGSEALSASSYDRAIGYFREAMGQTEEPGEAYILIAESQVGAGYTDEAEKTLLTLLDKDPENIIAFRMLTELYFENDNIDGLDSLAARTATDEERQIIDDYTIVSPQFSIPGGEYKDDVTLSLSAGGDYEIYYTVDGTEPGRFNGIHYDGEPLLLSFGSTEITAVCVRSDGKAGRAVSETYTIIYEAPSMPVVSPGGGRLTKETMVTITTDSPEAKIYYTWDGSVPTSSSREYTEPIQVPEGNSILSVIVIDKHGLISQVLQTNYIYLP